MLVLESLLPLDFKDSVFPSSSQELGVPSAMGEGSTVDHAICWRAASPFACIRSRSSSRKEKPDSAEAQE